MPNVYVTNPQVAIDITGRFFEAVDYLVAARVVRGYQTITDLWNIDRRNFAKLKSEPTRRSMKVEYIYYLERDFCVSSRWVITGKGRMLLNAPRNTEQIKPEMQ